MSSDTVLSVIRVLTTVSSTYMRLVPIFTMIRICKNKNIGQVNIVPLAAQWTSNHLWMLYGYVTNDIFPLLVTYGVGDFLSIIYLSVFYYWSTDKKYVVKVCAVALIVNIIVTIYAVVGYHFQARDVVTNIVGIIGIALSVLFYASPLTTIRKVIRTKNAASIPWGMLLAGTINNTLWTIYGLLISDILLTITAVTSASLGSTQLILYVIYRPRGKDTHSLSAVTPQEEEKNNDKSNKNPIKEIKIDAVELECPKFVENRLPSEIDPKM